MRLPTSSERACGGNIMSVIVPQERGRSRNLLRGAAYASGAAAVILHAMDRYAAGLWTGPPERLTWEPAAMLLSVALLLLAITRMGSRPVAALRIASVEAAAFVLANGVLIARDGWSRFFEAGYVTTGDGLVAALGGLAVRVMLIGAIAGLTRSQA